MTEILRRFGQEFTVEKVSKVKTRVINKRGLVATIEKVPEMRYVVECYDLFARWKDSHGEALESAAEMIVEKAETERKKRYET